MRVRVLLTMLIGLVSFSFMACSETVRSWQCHICASEDAQSQDSTNPCGSKQLLGEKEIRNAGFTSSVSSDAAAEDECERYWATDGASCTCKEN